MASTRNLSALLLRLDVGVVRLCAAMTRLPLARLLAITLSWSGNGLIYPALAAILIFAYGRRAEAPIIIGGINIAVLHCLYPIVKRWMARPRPYRVYTDLVPLLRPLDEHSFPSGHAMTLTAMLVPIVLVSGALFPSLLLWGAMAWSRLASAHHYPSDLFGGAVIGLIVSYPIAQLGLH